MKYMTSDEIRNTWLRFFEEKGHLIIPSASLIPIGDPTLLWINAGVAPLKKYFDGSETPKSKRMVNLQKSIRTNDIENVGKTARHHTFFEMMGNFSIGDYFKEEAIDFAYEILTSKDYFGFPLEKLYMTYYPTDLEAKDHWLKLGVKTSHVIPLEGNYWEIGAGPSGPCTEIYFDRGPKYDKRGIELLELDIDNERYVEIWNIVFSQYNAVPNKDRSEYKELPNKNIDTGAGLERFASILQDTKTNFETDLHLPVIKQLEKLSNIKYDGQMSYKVISDHIKTLVFAISDGANLSNEGRGYVLRRLLRRAVKYGRVLNLNEPFLYNLVDTVVSMMINAYPDLEKTKEIVKKIIKKEEEKFFSTINDGEKHLLDSIKDNKLSGEEAFKLYDTYGFPIELTLEYAEEKGIIVDLKGFKEALEEQKNRSRKARNVGDSMQQQDSLYTNFKTPSKFVGYDMLQTEAVVIKVFENGIVLDQTPFYATMGGQIHDSGTINGLLVTDVIKLPHGQFLHVIESESFSEGDEVLAIVDKETRNLTERNHTVTHLLHKAIKDTIGNHVNQQGSYNGPTKLTFDINHYESITDKEILKIEKIVKSKINENIPVITTSMSIDNAKKLGATMLFGEKYGDIVRVVNIGNWSIELCGGTHVKTTGEIKDFIISSVESIGSGTYRFEGFSYELGSTTNDYLKNLYDTSITLINKIKSLSDKRSFKISPPKLIHSYQDIINYRDFNLNIGEQLKELEKELENEMIAKVLKNADSLIPENVSPITYIYQNNLPNASLKPLIDTLYDKIKTDAVILINVLDDKASFLIKSASLNSRDLMNELTKATNGRGGGRDTFAQGGTNDLESLSAYLKGIEAI